MCRNIPYSNSPASATPGLRKIIAASAPLRFSEYIGLALYHEDLGYYAQTPGRVGRAGDYFTSVSCGPVFGMILAEAIADWWRSASIAGPWRIIEPGPDTGALASDVIEALLSGHPDVAAQMEYITIDPLPRPRTFQQQTLARFGNLVRCLADTSSLIPLPSFVIANEVIDALPCRLVEYRGGAWWEIHVVATEDGNELQETLAPLSVQEIPATLANHGSYPEGYRTELRDNQKDFLGSLTRVITRGRLLFFDYGFAAPEYYHRDRIKGTLRVYQNHSASETPLDNPGEADITAHVDFTALALSARELDCAVMRFESQEFFLTRQARPCLENWASQPGMLRNFQTLIHPGHLGGRFHALELSVGENHEDCTTALRRLAMQGG